MQQVALDTSARTHYVYSVRSTVMSLCLILLFVEPIRTFLVPPLKLPISVTALPLKKFVASMIHFAAYKSAGESITHPHLYWHKYVEGSVSLVEGILAAGVQQIVLSPMAAVYDSPDQLPITESAAIEPGNVYAETKAMMERIISWYGFTHGLRWVSLRYFTAAGASSDCVLGENWDITTNLIPLVMKAALGASGPLKVLGNDYPTSDGTGVHDYIHVEGLADAHAKAVDYLNDGNQI